MGAPKQAKPRPPLEAVDRLLAVAPNATVVVGADGRLVGLNTRAENLFGYSQAELKGKRTDLLMPTPGRARNGTHRGSRGVGRLGIRPLGYGLEAVVRRRDGTEFPVIVDLDFLEIGGETLIASAIREVKHERAQELDLRALVDASDDAIIGKTLDGTIVSWNQGADKLYGYK